VTNISVDKIKALLNGDRYILAEAAMNFRHDYGLLSEEEQKMVRFTCFEWFQACMKACEDIEVAPLKQYAKEAYRVVGCNGNRNGKHIRFVTDMDRTVGMISTDFKIIKGVDGQNLIELQFDTQQYQDLWYYKEEWVEKGFIKDGKFYKEMI